MRFDGGVGGEVGAKAARALRALSLCNQALVRATDEQTLLESVCRIIVEEGGYLFAWVGYAENDPGKTVRPVAQVGGAADYLEELQLTWADEERGRGPTGTAIRTGRPVVVRDLATDPRFHPWRAAAAQCGFRSSIALPLPADGDRLGALNVYAAEPDAFDQEEVALLTDLADSLAYGLRALRSRVELERTAHLNRVLVDSFPCVALLIRPVTREVVAANAAARAAGAFPGRTCFETWAKQKAPCPWCLAPELWATGEPRHLVVEANDVVWDAHWIPVAADLYMHYIFDITERRSVEQALGKAEEQLRHAQKLEAVGRLAGGIAHDFNNLLTTITGYSDILLAREELAPALRRDIEEIRKAADRAAVLTRQLLAFSRRQALRPQVMNLNDAVRSMAGLYRSLLGESVSVVTRLQPDLRPVEVDPAQIEQVLMNLVINAKDAMPEGGNVTIETQNVELDSEYARAHVSVSPGAYVMLSVSDTGHGMTKEVQEQIFEPFFTTKPHGKGTGLGLSTVYGIVKQSGGNIWVYSEPGRGTTFKVYFPQVHEAAVTRPAEETVDRLEPAGGGETLLLVEDEAAVRQLVFRVLAGHGYTVLVADSGDEALRLLESRGEPIALLLTDVILPGMSGRELADRLRGRLPGLKVLYMSGYTQNAIVHDGRLDADVAFLEKPFTPEDLVRRVREVLGSG